MAVWQEKHKKRVIELFNKLHVVLFAGENKNLTFTLFPIPLRAIPHSIEYKHTKCIVFTDGNLLCLH